MKWYMNKLLSKWINECTEAWKEDIDKCIDEMIDERQWMMSCSLMTYVTVTLE